ncbi:MAG: chitinase C-terminal domain-containing protein [Micrococcales bacterium]|nr:chitinase C-terminal domain-containing protein [Micrococcales bacterium]
MIPLTTRVRAAALVAAAAVAASLLSAVGAQAAADCAPGWSSQTVYVGGDLASSQQVNYRAKWWTQNEAPGASQWGPWESLGSCAPGGGDPTPTPTPTDPEPTPTPTPTDPGDPASTNPDEKCRPDGLYETPGVDVPYCTVYDEAGREKLPNGLEQRVIGYFTSWRTGADGTPRYLASDIPWTKLSHINYAFAHIDGAGKVSVNQTADGNPATDMTWPGVAGAQMDPAYPYTGHFNLLNHYKTQHPGVKTLVSVGGWAETGGYFDVNGARVADGGFYTLTDQSARIEAVADSAVAFIRQYGFDGVDIDYEYPTSNAKAGNPLDASFSDARRGTLFAGYQTLMKTLREKLDRAGAADGRHYLLTVAAPASGWLLRGMEVMQVTQYLDYVNIMSYDLHGSWNQYVGGNAPLYDNGADPELAAAGVYGAYAGIGYLNTDWAYHYFRGSMPAGRINIGVPFYTRGWTGVTGGTDGLGGTAALADQAQCPPGTGPGLGGTSRCGAGAQGIDNIWHDLDGAGQQIGAGVNPIWHALNLQHGIVGDYLTSYDAPTTITGSYAHRFDTVSKTEWWWNATTRTFLSGDSDDAIRAKADYVADNGLGGVMIWELAGDYAYDPSAGQYEMGSTLVGILHDRLAASAPYGASKADAAMPAKAIDLEVRFSEFALGDNNYPINPRVTFVNNSGVDIPAGATITFDTATSDTGALKEQNGWGIVKLASGHSGDNVGGLDGDFHSYRLTVPSGGIPAGGSAWTKLSWSLPMSAISNLRVTIGGESYATLYDHPRGVTVVAPGGGSGGGGGGTGGDCSAAAWSATAVYTGGAVVSYRGAEYTAKWWTQGETPGSAQVWGTARSC